jgi:hypothetical protein
MVNVGIYIYTDSIADLSSLLIDNFATRVYADGGTFEAPNCLLIELQNLGGFSGIALQAKRIELFADEKISVTSSIQNINNIGATYSDFSQTFTIPATKNNNKIFKHWYENSLDTQFNTLVKADAYIELDTIPFRVGKIQLESCDIKDNYPQSYSITFIGNLGNLKDSFAGLFLKDLNSDDYDFTYTGNIVKNKVVANTASDDVMFPLISSDRYWNYGAGGLNDINVISTPIRYNELFPAIRLNSIFNMIEDKFNVNLQGTTENPSTFLTDGKFISAYLYLKNSDSFSQREFLDRILFDETGENSDTGYEYNLTTQRLNNNVTAPDSYNSVSFSYKFATLKITPSVNGEFYTIYIYKNGALYFTSQTFTSVSGVIKYFGIESTTNRFATNDYYEFYIGSTQSFQYDAEIEVESVYEGISEDFSYLFFVNAPILQTPSYKLQLSNYMPEIKIEDFFAGVLKMFNLTCYSSNGVDYTIDTLESYYNLGEIIDLTKYVKTDATNLTRVKTYKKINFLYEKSESLVNVGFNSNAGIEYGNLLYTTNNDGEEYSIKLPFEDLNFNNLKDKLQVGYALKTDLQKYIPKPIILYDYNPAALTNLTDTNFYFSNELTGNGTNHTSYKAFGQEYFDGTNTYSLNFPEQQSTLTNEVITNSLYQIYYSDYIENIFNYRARLVKVTAVLPISVLTSLKLNNRVIIRDKRYIINSFTTDLTTGEASFELITDLRTL